jgi:multicomponent Na+:H+ antiporter subunit D
MAGKGDTAADIDGAMVIDAVPLADWLAVAPLVMCLFFGALLLMFRKETRQQPIVAIGALILLCANNVALLMRVVDQGPIVMTMGRWLPPFGISFVVDLLGAIMVLTASVVVLAGAVYANATLPVAERRYGFFPLLLLMTGGVCGAFLTGDIFNMYVWFEVLLISSFGLLVLGSEREQIDGAVKYAFLNLVATTLFLIATGLVYGTFGTLNMADIARKAPGLAGTAPLLTLSTLYLLAFGMKAGAFPVNFWLPASYHTPRIVVSALFAGLLTKVGVYALVRTFVTILPLQRDVLAEFVAWIAAVTMILGVLSAIAQSDIRRMLGYMVISGIGIMLAGLSLASPLALSGTILYAVHSMLAMTALYLLAGIMIRRTGSTSLHDARGLYTQSPALAALALILFLAISGLPPFSGLWPKVMLVTSSFDAGAWGLAAAILITGLLTTIAFGRFFLLAFWRDGDGHPVPTVQLADGRMFWVTAALAVAIIALGVYPAPVIRLTNAAAVSLLDQQSYIDVVFPPGRN